MENLSREQFHVLALDTKHKVLASVDLYHGSVDQASIRPAEVFGVAMKLDASAVALVHNHPSGDPTPSPEDVSMTRRLSECGRLLDIEVVDHLIIGASGQFVSMRARNLGFD